MKRYLLLSTLFLLSSLTVLAQTTPTSGTVGLNGQNGVINTSVPFLNFTPDARSGALGDAGVAQTPDASAIFWNPSKLVFSQQDAGVSASYTPWLRNITDDMYYAYVSGYKKAGKNQVFGASMLFFNLGAIDFTTSQGVSAGTFNSQEYAVALSYSRLISKNFSLGVNLKYLNSNLASGATSIKPGSTVAADISAYYQNQVRDDATGKGIGWAYGLMLSNIGGTLNYGGTGAFSIPTNLKLGGRFTYFSDQYNRFNFLLDVNKILVPTPNGSNAGQTGISGIFGSFSGQQGGFSELLREFTVSTGVEYWYNEQFAARVGYFGEADDKGGRKYFTAGLGFRAVGFPGVDFSYVFPTSGRTSPLSNVYRVSLLFDINKGRPRTTTPDDAEE
jgi:hypothetical protein